MNESLTLEAAVLEVLVDAMTGNPEPDLAKVAADIVDAGTTSWAPSTSQLLATGWLAGSLTALGEHVNVVPADGSDEPGDLIRWSPRGTAVAYDLRIVGRIG